MTTEQARRLIKISIAIAIMAAGVLVVGSSLIGEIGSPTRIPALKPLPWDQSKARTSAPSFAEAAAGALLQPGKPRSTAEYYARRAYSGAPPLIPHEVESGARAESGKLCLTCHAKGGYVEKYAAYAPLTPHPELTQCRQCHAAQQTTESFVEIDWASARPPRTRRSALPGSPPPLPHPAQMRENCMACHAGPAAISAIRTPHPDRVNCVQCHVPAKTSGEWRRKETVQ